MAVTATTYIAFADALAKGEVNLSTDTIKAVLLDSYTPSTSHKYLSDVLAAGTESSGTGYTSGGATLDSVTWGANGGGYMLDCADEAIDTTGGSLSAAYIVYVDTTPGSNSTNPVIAYWDLGGAQTSTNGTFTITPDATGLFRIG